ncbi:M20 metallopeptidase family protein [Amycolatopsis vancoresmycina]|uniref:N-acyl-L-amino acid amidohydrolase n=1 Tax=Amycolatopsis vancoresmycina DSM 44592 TaxID=1292037 RepID=R1I542_9PSEU|nr:amidohydrolase [Amycolatopsis vancoresmycina]EOD67651.1 N-acyl-L-amino acid amidohydrolase [Amycolatopsis vancoresmycina DSM 44592]
MSDLWTRWTQAIAEELPAAVELRHAVHADPRGSGDEEDTARLVSDALGAGDGTRVAKTGRAVLLPGGAGPAVALRAELDALPVLEGTGVPWASGNDLMHACGHDVHLAALVAVGRAAVRVGVPRPILALLQPREETSPPGALDVVESGVLAAHGVDTVIGAHVQPRIAHGVVSSVPGPVNASTDEFEVTMHGQGGHAGYPHLLRDPILALSQLVVSLQQLASRRIDPVFGAVCSIGRIQGGAAANVVPNSASAFGSLRLMRAKDRERALETLADIVHGTARAHGCTAELEISPCEPVLDNDPALAAGAQRWLRHAGFTVDDQFRSFGADDFAHYCGGGTRGLMMFVGLGDTAGVPSLHDERFLPRDQAVTQVAHALVAGYLAALDAPVP